MPPPRTAQMWGTAQKLGPTNLNMIEFEGSKFQGFWGNTTSCCSHCHLHVPSPLSGGFRCHRWLQSVTRADQGLAVFAARLGWEICHSGGSGGIMIPDLSWSRTHVDWLYIYIRIYIYNIKTPFIDGTTHYHTFNLYNPCYICWILLVTVYLQLPDNIKQLHWVCLNIGHAA